MTAKEWRENNPKLEGRMSKYCMIEIAFNNKEEINEARMIENGSDK